RVGASSALARLCGLASTAVLGACSLSVLDGLSDGRPDAADDGSSPDVTEVRGGDASMETSSADVSMTDAPFSASDVSSADRLVPMEAASSDVVDATVVQVDSGACAGGCPGNGYCYTTEC